MTAKQGLTTIAPCRMPGNCKEERKLAMDHKPKAACVLRLGMAAITIAALGDVPLEQAGVFNDDLLCVQRIERIHESC